MRNTRKSGQISRSKKPPRPTLRSGRGSRTNSNTSHQIPARVIEAESARAAPPASQPMTRLAAGEARNWDVRQHTELGAQDESGDAQVQRVADDLERTKEPIRKLRTPM